MLFLGWPKHSGCSLKLHLVASQRLFFVGIHLLGYGATVRRGRLYPIYVGYIILSGMFQKHVLVTRYVLVIYNYICILLYIICVCVCVLYNYSIFFTWKYRQVVNIIGKWSCAAGETRAYQSATKHQLGWSQNLSWIYMATSCRSKLVGGWPTPLKNISQWEGLSHILYIIPYAPWCWYIYLHLGHLWGKCWNIYHGAYGHDKIW